MGEGVRAPGGWGKRARGGGKRARRGGYGPPGGLISMLTLKSEDLFLFYGSSIAMISMKWTNLKKHRKKVKYNFELATKINILIFVWSVKFFLFAKRQHETKIMPHLFLWRWKIYSDNIFLHYTIRTLPLLRYKYTFLSKLTRKFFLSGGAIARFIKPYRDESSAFVIWISVRFYETDCK